MNGNNNFKELTITKVPKKSIAVVGGGFFGILSALKLIERGFSVTLFEKERDILQGASFINQNRIHMGYHYPRSYETALSSYNFQSSFVNMFKEAVVGNFDHFYCIAKHGSLTSSKQYLEFCKRLNLPHTVGFPSNITMSKNMVDLCIKVPENVYDANIVRKKLWDLINENGINILLSSEIVGIKKIHDVYEILYKSQNKIQKKQFDAIVNASYSNINNICKMAGVKTKEYQYELCEVPIIKVPWQRRTGFAIMDGPFFGIMPFGFSNDYMVWDVELSVLEKSVGELPKFKFGIDHYDRDNLRKERSKKFIEKAKQYVKEIESCKHLYSIYVVKIVQKDREKDDARPTELIAHGNGFWSIFSGKVGASIPAAETIANEIVKFFDSNGSHSNLVDKYQK